MLKIFLTGDNHIGLSYTDRENGRALSEKRIAAFDSMVNAANLEGCDLFVIAGDLFDEPHSVPSETVSRLNAVLGKFSGTVAVLPGNHDFYDGDVNVWKLFGKTVSPNTVLLCENRVYTLKFGDETVNIYPAPCFSQHSKPNQNNIGWILDRNIDKNNYNIGIAHGSVEGETVDSGGIYFPMTRGELSFVGMDIWLIGHTHVPFPKDLDYSMKPTHDRIFNAGSHVQTDSSNNTEGLCFIIEIDESKQIRAKKFHSGNVRFYHREAELMSGRVSETLEAALSDIEDGSAVKIDLMGALSAEELCAIGSEAEKVSARFLDCIFNYDGLSRLITEESIKREFAETSLSAKLLTALLDRPREAQMVYELIKSAEEGK